MVIMINCTHFVVCILIYIVSILIFIINLLPSDILVNRFFIYLVYFFSSNFLNWLEEVVMVVNCRFSLNFFDDFRVPRFNFAVDKAFLHCKTTAVTIVSHINELSFKFTHYIMVTYDIWGM